MNSENLYAEREIMAMGNYYMRHVDRMTREGLRAKSDIAAELGFRDMEIDRLRARVAELEAARGEPLRNADTPRADLLDKSLREYAHKRRIEACCAWSDVKNNDGSLNEAKCNYASTQEAYLKSAIDELADLSTKHARSFGAGAMADGVIKAAAAALKREAFWVAIDLSDADAERFAKAAIDAAMAKDGAP